MIRSLLDSGKCFSSGRLKIYHDRNIPGMENDYAGAFLISKSAGNAVERNRIKRWLREDLRLWQQEKKDKLNGGIVIRFLGVASEADHRSLKKNLTELCNKLKQANQNA